MITKIFDEAKETMERGAATMQRAAAEIIRLRTVNAELLAALEEAREFVSDHVDVLDGDYGEPRPNRAMQLLPEIDDAIARAKGESPCP